ncbi:hypothetical protein EGW08_016049 [Elysia chlorotica]|uniref:Peptidase S1 domain-containing protein n=1 Tax=Elysia chlorotica TaxID=188477 RepID=A0A433T3R8_ELYCH|nr:hypothetical protein EGW08_016049 [Elysia chlorotica]
MSVEKFTTSHLQRLSTEIQRRNLRALLDLTVRVRLAWTSRDRPDEDVLSVLRGYPSHRLGSGIVRGVSRGGPSYKKQCPCETCGGKGSRNFWKFVIRTARHVVFNTEEAQKTEVDFFYDDENYQFDAFKTAKGLAVVWSKRDTDISDISCVTHDEVLGEKVTAAWRCLNESETRPSSQSELDLLPSCSGLPGYTALVFSHPHGQPKRVTLGDAVDREYPFVAYSAATCPGSSGAPVFLFRGSNYLPYYSPVHSGSCAASADQNGRLNNGNVW